MPTNLGPEQRFEDLGDGCLTAIQQESAPFSDESLQIFISHPQHLEALRIAQVIVNLGHLVGP
eukprot:7513943-Pyramimonas_sp.AAC.1